MCPRLSPMRYPLALFWKTVAALVLTCGALQARTFLPSQLNAEPQKYDGKTLTVRGFVVLAPEGHNLRDSKAIYDKFAEAFDSNAKYDPSFDLRDYEGYCLTIANPSFLYDHIQEYRSKTLVLRGRFVAKYLRPDQIDLGACPLPTGFYVDIDDLRRRYPPKSGRPAGHP